MLEYSQKVSDVSAKGLEQQIRIEQLETLNLELMNQESEAREHVMDLHNWAGIDEVNFASNFKIWVKPVYIQLSKYGKIV